MIAKNARPLNVILALIGLINAPATLAGWPETLDETRRSVVTIRVDQTRAFDDEWNKSSEATGFIVDRERGLILTNRHVVSPGPVNAVAEFSSGEEVRLVAIYRDPVHDFGVFGYDPADLEYTDPGELELAPGRLRVGLDVRVIGNDAGERFQVLAGTISRLDRNAPEYKSVGYNDFNTFYVQAATGTSGGSSGSPVIDSDGYVVALNAGAGSRAQSSFFLPLDRVVPALESIRAGRSIPRGTLLATLVHTPFAELEHLGLPTEELRATREHDPQAIGLLKVERLIPGSPAAAELAVGDILLTAARRRITRFAEFEALLDGRVAEPISLEVQRGAQRLATRITVSDLHAVTPDAFLELGNALLHTLSYQFARGINQPVRGVLVASPGYTLERANLTKGAVITEIDGSPVDDLDAFIAHVENRPDGTDIRVQYFVVDNPRVPRFTVIKLDRRWLSTRICRRPVVGDWTCRSLAEPPPAPEPAAEAIAFGPYEDPIQEAIGPSLVNLIFEPPVGLTGLDESIRRGVGLIVDWDAGLVVTRRATVPHGVGRVSIIFDGKLERDASVVFVHPLHGITLLHYDPGSLLGHPEPPRWRDTDPEPGARVWLLERSQNYRVTATASEVGPTRIIESGASSSLAFRETNLEARSLPRSAPGDGVVVDSDLLVVGLVDANEGSPGRYIMPRWLIEESVRNYRERQPIGSLELEVAPLPLSNARRLGLPSAWVDRITANAVRPPQVLVIVNALPGGPLGEQTQPGDLLLTIDGELIADFRQLEQASQTDREIEVMLWRGEAEVAVQTRTAWLDGIASSHYVTWAGALFHAPHRAARFAGVTPGVPYVPFYYYGSPASRAGLKPLWSLLSLNDEPLHGLDDLIAAIQRLEPAQWARIRLRSWTGDEDVVTIYNDPKYWPGLDVRVRAEDGETVVEQRPF